MKNACELLDSIRLVGDPIDAVTGNVVERVLDFRLPGPLPLTWFRLYDTQVAHQPFALGFGQTHWYDRRLQFDIDGIQYIGPLGKVVPFNLPETDGQTVAHQGFLLQRVTSRLFRLAEVAGPVMLFEFDDSLRPAQLAQLQRGEAAIEFRYDEQGRLAMIIDSTGRALRIECDFAGRVRSILLAARPGSPPGSERIIIKYEFDDAGNLHHGVDAYGSEFHMDYDAQHYMIRKTDRRGYSFRYDYDAQGRCIHSSGEDGFNAVWLEYQPLEHITKVTQADGGVWTYLYDDRKAIARILDPLNQVTEFRNDEAGRLAERVDPLGAITRFLYSSEGALLGQLDAFGQFHAGQGPRRSGSEEQLRPEILPRIHQLCDGYPLHRPASWKENSLRVHPVRYEYGNLFLPWFTADRPDLDVALLQDVPAAIRDAMVRTHAQLFADPGARYEPRPLLPPRQYPPGVYEHDVFGTLVRHTDPAGGTQRWVYDRGGNIVQHRDRDDRVWHYEYGSFDLLVRETSPQGAVAMYGYGAKGNVTSVRDPAGHVSEFEYDPVGQLSAIRRDGSLVERFAYDAGTQSIEKFGAGGEPLWKAYLGPAGQPTALELASGARYEFAYDELGRCIASNAPDGSIAIAYDELGNAVADLRDGRGIRHEYDAFDAVRSVVFDRFVMEYVRERGALVVVDPAGGRHVIRGLPGGAILRELSSGTAEAALCQYDGKWALKGRYRRRQSGPTHLRVYQYSLEGDLRRIEDSAKGLHRFEYDADHRLIAEFTPELREHRYAYDAGGALLQQPGLARVSIGSMGRLAMANGARFEYDAAGRVATRIDVRGETRYDYDSLGRLIRCRAPGLEWSARYDGFGRRIAKTVNGRTREFFWDGQRLAAEIDHDGGLRIYVYANPLALTPILFIDYASIDAEPASGETRFVFCDQIGTPVLLEDGDGNAVWQATIRPFGERQVDAASSVEFSLGFPGHYVDEELGLNCTRFRHYDPVAGRYLQPDPDDLAGGLNLYAYTSRPLVEVDLDGRCPKKTPPLDPDEDAKDKAQKMAARIRNELDQDPNAHGFTAHDNVTYAVMVVTMADGSQRTVVVSSGDRRSIHPELRGVVAGDRYVSPSSNPPGETGHHAEQRAMAWARENSNNPDPSQRVTSINAISPTRPCCPGCTGAIQRRGDPNLDVVQPPAGVPKTR